MTDEKTPKIEVLDPNPELTATQRSRRFRGNVFGWERRAAAVDAIRSREPFPHEVIESRLSSRDFGATSH